MSNIFRWTEFEDWVEFYSNRQLAYAGGGKYEAVMNFGGPGSAAPYHFYARVVKGAEDCITEVSVEKETFIAKRKVVSIKGTPPGFVWVYLGCVKMRRNYRRVTICAPGGLRGLERLCIVETPERLESGEVERRLAREGKGPEALSGVPLGGVGGGKIELCRDGLFRNITINGNIDTPIWRTEGSFFAVRAETEGKSLGRIISTEPLHGLAPMQELQFDGLFPKATLRGKDRDFPLAVQVFASGTIIPHNIKDSALPVALFRVRLIGRKEKSVKATVAFCMENFLGIGGSVASLEKRETMDEGYYNLWQERAGNSERPWKASGAEGLLFDGGEKEEKRSEGSYILAADSGVCCRLSGWRFEEKNDVWSKFVDTGELPSEKTKPSAGEKTAGAIAVEVDLEPGEVKDVRFVFAWYVPHFRQAGDFDYTHFYCNDFSSVEEVVLYAFKNFDRLEKEAGEVPGLLLKSTLPEWLSRSLANDAYVISTASWLTKDGRFSINEGPTHMFGCMGTLDQKLYANHYYSLFFPRLDRTELLGFIRAQGEDGGIQHDLGYGHLEKKAEGHFWPDLSSSLAILSLKHYQLTGDEEYLNEAYPSIVKALLDYQLSLDTDDDGIANISGVGNTFDAEEYEGTSSYIASVWLAALRALEELARRRGDGKVVERCRKVFEKARKNAVEELWNGRYFANYYDAASKFRSPNSHFSQVAGEFFARLCGLGELYGDHYVRQALTSMLRLNFHPDLAFPTNEATPQGKMPCRKMWGWLPHARVYLGGTPLYFGMAEEGLQVLERLEKALVEINDDNRWDQRLFYEPDTGKQHWGRFYMTAPATWYVYQALLGYRWDEPLGVLAIVPNLPEKLLPFEGPLFVPGFWAWLKVDRNQKKIAVRFLKKFAREIEIKEICLPLWAGTLEATADGELIRTKLLGTKGDLEARYQCRINPDNVDEVEFCFR